MSCGVETLVILVQLARGLVAAPEGANVNQFPNTTTLEHRWPACTMELTLEPFGLRHLTRPEQLRCEADMAEAKDKDAKAKLADYKEFQRLADKCSERVAGTGTVTQLGTVTSSDFRLLPVTGDSGNVIFSDPTVWKVRDTAKK